MNYLIVKCEPLCDQRECDADRKPMFICDNWDNLKLDYAFEVYQINGNNPFILVKGYDTPMESGMALYYWKKDDDCENVQPTVIRKWKDRCRYDEIPEEAKKMIKKGKDVNDWLENCGEITWFDKHNNYCLYAEYSDNYFSLGY